MAFTPWGVFFRPFDVMHWGGPSVGFDAMITDNSVIFHNTRFLKYRIITKGKTVLAEVNIDAETRTTLDRNNGYHKDEVFGNQEEWGILSNLGDNFGDMVSGFSSETSWGWNYTQGSIEFRLEDPITMAEATAAVDGYLAAIDLASEPTITAKTFAGYAEPADEPTRIRTYIIRPPSRLGQPLPPGVNQAHCAVLLTPFPGVFPWDGTFLMNLHSPEYYDGRFSCDLRTSSPTWPFAARGFPVSDVFGMLGTWAIIQGYSVGQSGTYPFREISPGGPTLWRLRNDSEGLGGVYLMSAKSHWCLPAGMGCSRISRDAHIQPFNQSNGIVEAAHCGGVDIPPGAADLAASGHEWIHAGNFPLGLGTTCCS